MIRNKKKIGRSQVVMIQILITNGKMEKGNWIKLCQEKRVVHSSFYRNLNQFLEKDLINIYMDIVEPDIENIKKYFGKFVKILDDFV